MRRAFLTLLLVMTAFAGCLSDDPDDGTSTGTDDPVGTADLPTSLVVPSLHPLQALGTGAGEPSISSSPDGTVYASSIGPLWSSKDGGATWTLESDVVDGGGDGDIAVDQSGRLHWLGLFGDSGPIPYQHSSDDGKTWSESVDVSNGTGGDREWIVARWDEPTVYAAWRGTVDNQNVISFTSSFNAGDNWTDLVTISEDAIGGPLAVGPVPGLVYQAQATFASGETSMDAAVRLARSHDHGATWQIVPIGVPTQSVQEGLIGFPFSIFPVVDADEAGNLYVVYSVDQGALPADVPKPAARYGVYLQVSSDAGDSWSAPRLLSSTDHAAIMPWVAAGAEGRIAVTWYENTLGVPHDNLPDAWNVILYEALDAQTEAPQEVRVTLTDSPNHIGSVCTSGTGCLLSGGDRSILDFFEVTITADGQPVAVWAATDAPYAGTVVNVNIQARGVADGTPLR